jgi:hypothetical protein
MFEDLILALEARRAKLALRLHRMEAPLTPAELGRLEVLETTPFPIDDEAVHLLLNRRAHAVQSRESTQGNRGAERAAGMKE